MGCACGSAATVVVKSPPEEIDMHGFRKPTPQLSLLEQIKALRLAAKELRIPGSLCSQLPTFLRLFRKDGQGKPKTLSIVLFSYLTFADTVRVSGVCRSLYHLTGHKDILSLYSKNYSPDCLGPNDNLLSIQEGNLIIFHRQSINQSEGGRISAFRQNIDILDPDCAIQFGRQFFKRSKRSLAQSSIITAHFLETNPSVRAGGRGTMNSQNGDTSEWNLSFRDRGISITSQKLEQLSLRATETPSPDKQADFPRFLTWKKRKSSRRGGLSSFRVLQETDERL